MIFVAGGTIAGSLARTIGLVVMRIRVAVVGCAEHLGELAEGNAGWSQG
jgi:hypothetical protein